VQSLGSYEGLDSFLDGTFGTDAHVAIPRRQRVLSSTGGDSMYAGGSRFDSDGASAGVELDAGISSPESNPKPRGVQSLFDLVVYRPKTVSRDDGLAAESGVVVADFGNQELETLASQGQMQVTLSTGEQDIVESSPRPRSSGVTSREGTDGPASVSESHDTPTAMNEGAADMADLTWSPERADGDSIAAALMAHEKSIQVIVGANNQLGLDGGK
jgi:hypothetical protein